MATEMKYPNEPETHRSLEQNLRLHTGKDARTSNYPAAWDRAGVCEVLVGGEVRVEPVVR